MRLPSLRGRLAIAFGVALAVLYLLARRNMQKPFPPDTTPEGAYVRIVYALHEDHPERAFAYLETEAQWASYTLRDMRAKALGRVKSSYPEGERAELVTAYGPYAEAKDGADVFALEARRKGLVTRMKRDLSGVASVDVRGERATVVTARGTRYPFRKRDNGIWGLTIFTAELLAEAERATRDLAVVEKAASDYAAASPAASPAASSPR